MSLYKSIADCSFTLVSELRVSLLQKVVRITKRKGSTELTLALIIVLANSLHAA